MHRGGKFNEDRGFKLSCICGQESNCTHIEKELVANSSWGVLVPHGSMWIPTDP